MSAAARALRATPVRLGSRSSTAASQPRLHRSVLHKGRGWQDMISRRNRAKTCARRRLRLARDRRFQRRCVCRFGRRNRRCLAGQLLCAHDDSVRADVAGRRRNVALERLSGSQGLQRLRIQLDDVLCSSFRQPLPTDVDRQCGRGDEDYKRVHGLLQSLTGPKAAGAGKGDRHLLPERPFGCFAQKVPVPFSRLFSRLAALQQIIAVIPAIASHLNRAAGTCHNVLGKDTAMKGGSAGRRKRWLLAAIKLLIVVIVVWCIRRTLGRRLGATGRASLAIRLRLACGGRRPVPAWARCCAASFGTASLRPVGPEREPAAVTSRLLHRPPRKIRARQGDGRHSAGRAWCGGKGVDTALAAASVFFETLTMMAVGAFHVGRHCGRLVARAKHCCSGRRWR